MNKELIRNIIEIILAMLIIVCDVGIMFCTSKLKRENTQLKELNDELAARLTYSEQALKEQVGEADFYRRLWEENK